MRQLKQGARILSIATGPINGKRALLLGVVSQSARVEGILSSKVSVNGTDSTGKIIAMLKRSRFAGQVGMIALNGIAQAGLNVVDAELLKEKLGAEVIVLTRHRPRPSLLIAALRKYGKRSNADVSKSVALVRAQKKPVSLDGFYVSGTKPTKTLRKLVPITFEMLRLSHLIARGVSTGESKGRI
ncbi:MAG: DUF99 family protein [Candidatus Micrarchaeota archaeon]|nr:DUF99 family protein [Candidatus Micrarchaeota archaeon]